MYCPKCGGKVGEPQPFCGSCGARLPEIKAEHQQKRKLSRFDRAILWTGGILLGLFVLYCILSIPGQSKQEGAVAYCCKSDTRQVTQQDSVTAPDTKHGASSHQEARQNSPQNAPNMAGVTGQSQMSGPYPIGDRISVGYWSYVCNNAYWTPILGSDAYSMERANADFVVVNITVRNDDTSSSTLPPFQLLDLGGRTYDESSAGTLSPGFFSVLEGLNPGVSKRGNVAFDVPPGQQYYLIVSGGIESDKRASVVLPTSEPNSNAQPPPSSIP